MRLQRYKDCAAKDRVITYTVQPSQYHMFFSSEGYTEPDVVVVYGNAYEMMSSSEGEKVHSEISYRNMTYSRDTVLVLMDETKELVRQGVNAVKAARSVDQLISPQTNPFKGIGTNRAELDSNVPINNEKSYLTCVRRSSSASTKKQKE